MNVYVTGIGVTSALGLDVEGNLNALLSEKTGVTKTQYLKTTTSFLTAEVKASNLELKSILNIDKSIQISRTSLLGILAAKQALSNLRDVCELDFISATSVGGMDLSEGEYRNYMKEEAINFNQFLTHPNGDTTSKIAEYFGFNGLISTISTACSSGANAIMMGARLIKAGKTKRVLVGGTDALTNFTVNGFNSLMIYDNEWCKPFDENRKGLNLGEGAAYLLLESEQSIKETKNKPYCKVTGWGNTSDAYHQTASSPDGKGATLAIKQAIEQAGISEIDIDYINAHGTGTKNNDESESTALKNIFGNSVPEFSSTKAYTGHTLAAAGAIEGVFAALAIAEGLVFPNLNFNEPIKATGLHPVSAIKRREVNCVLSNSFGFGGNNTTLIFQKT